jgi:glycosyltransferase involved in cell wall biosynthesis
VRVLILTQYFPPETGAPQNRLFQLAKFLRENGTDVSVLTAMPNYPHMKIFGGYAGKKYAYEVVHGIEVHRCYIYVTQNRSVINRLLNYFSFVLSARYYGKKIQGKFDILFCESPPLFLAWTAMFLSGKKKAKLVFNVSDLWPESAEKLGVVTNRFLLKLAYRLEARVYRRSALVSGQTKGICSDINRRFPAVKTWWLPNGADLAIFSRERAQHIGWRKSNSIGSEDFVFLYAGIIGIAQGLETIIHAASIMKKNTRVKFVLMGSGPEKEKLRQMATGLQLFNVLFPDPCASSAMPSIMSEVNAAIIPLKKLPIFEGAVPSKIFEALAMEVPVLLGVIGEAYTLFVEQGKCAIPFEPENAHSLAGAAQQLMDSAETRETLARNGRDYVSENFDRNKIAAAFSDELRSLTGKNSGRSTSR